MHLVGYEHHDNLAKGLGNGEFSLKGGEPTN
jgi:hypothetical protein